MGYQSPLRSGQPIHGEDLCDVTGDGGSLLKPRLVPTSQGGDQPLPSCCQGDTCLELLGSEIGRNDDIQREDIKFSDILEELHKN